MKHHQSTQYGTLYIVATPIGNKDDITLRALQVLKSVDLILAEDTRHSLPLLSALGIQNTLQSLHAHNEHEKSDKIIEQLMHGSSIALISDAGTPLICDPGFPLVKKAKEQGIQVTPIPGACAFITALSAAGIPCDSFQFLGFLPAKEAARQAKFATVMSSNQTVIFYESTHRIIDCLKDASRVLGEHSEIVLAKELTKTFERIIRAPIKNHLAWLLDDHTHTKGEFVVIIPPQILVHDALEHDALLEALLDELPLKQAVALAVKITKSNKNELYNRALVLKDQRR
jgi:16S rRNA (cytidine1402-2'-O)-methyltransferase